MSKKITEHFSDIDENLSDMVYVKPSVKKYKKIIEHNDDSAQPIKLPSDLEYDLEVNLDQSKSSANVFNIFSNNLFLQPSSDGSQLTVKFPIPPSNPPVIYMWVDSKNGYYINGDESQSSITFLSQGSDEYTYEAVTNQLGQINYVNVQKLNTLYQVTNYLNYKFSLSSDPDKKYDAYTEDNSLYFDLPNQDGTITTVGPLVLDTNYNFPVYHGTEGVGKVTYCYFTDKDTLNFTGKYLGQEFTLEAEVQGISVIGIFYFILTIIALILSYKCNKGIDILHLCCAFYYSPCYIIYILIFNFSKCLS
tara:strand:- start:569 stop:1486 length:918 start_codon:yes stop_codon:yes gene_type:complete